MLPRKALPLLLLFVYSLSQDTMFLSAVICLFHNFWINLTYSNLKTFQTEHINILLSTMTV